MKTSPYILFEVDKDRRLVHLLNEFLALPLLHKLGLKRRTLKARVLPVVDSNMMFKDGCLHNLHLTASIETALRYNHNPKAVDTVDVLAIYRSPSSEAQEMWQQVMYDHMKLRDHSFLRAQPEVKSHRAFVHFARMIRQHVKFVGRFIDEHGSQQHKDVLEIIQDDLDKNTSGAELAYPVTAIEAIIRRTHMLLLNTSP